MCKGGGSSSSTIDPRIMSMLQQNYASAQNVANRPYQPYTGDLTAGLTDAQNQAGSLLQAAPGMGQGAIGAGINAAAQGAQYQAPQVQSGMYNPAMAEAAQINPGQLPFLSAPNGLEQLRQYMNPYTADVTNTTLNDLNRQTQQQLVNDAQNATADNAFGGTRQAVADALTNEAAQRTAASTLANLNNQGFNTASGLLQNNQGMGLQAGAQNLGAALRALGQNAGLQQGANLANAGALNMGSQFDLSQALNAALANQSAANISQQLNNQSAGLLGALGTQQNQNYLAGTSALNNFGTEQQQTQQNALNAAYQQFMNQFNYPVQMQGLLNNSLLLGGAGTTNPTAGMQNAGGLLGGLGSLGSVAAMLLPFL